MAFFYRLLSFAAGLATFVLAVQTALAADTVINFDPPAAPALWTRLSTEYQSDGVVFGGGPTGDVYRTATEANWYSPVAHSGTQFAVIEQSMCSGEIRVNDAWARFVSPRQHVQVYVRELTSANPYTLIP